MLLKIDLLLKKKDKAEKLEEILQLKKRISLSNAVEVLKELRKIKSGEEARI